jgi:peptide/nickel transport system substrate-binding protein
LEPFVSRSIPGIAAVCALLLAFPEPVENPRNLDDRGVVVIAALGDVTTPIPTVNDNQTNFDVVNLLFLRLAELGPTLTTVGDRGFRPMLARSWQRRDSVTLVFDLDPRAVWHDGVPVTAEDVVFSYQRAKEASDLARALRRVQSVTAEGQRRVIFRFTRAYGEQLYDATFQLLIIPSHLLRSIPRDSLATSAFAQHPVGNGAFRWVRRVPGQLVELAAFDQFFLGRPRINRVLFRVAPDPDARLNLLLSGEADIAQSLALPAEARVRQQPELQVIPVISTGITYGLFNQRARGDRSRPHPILADAVVRRALVLALDREAMTRSVYGGHAKVPDGPVPQAFAWVDVPGYRTAAPDTARARALLASAGWQDSDADGTLDKNGIPLELSVQAPNRTPQRPMLAQQMQARFRQIGVKLNVEIIEGAMWLDRRNKGEFDIDMSNAILDPTPSGWNWSWSCEGAGQSGRNVGSYCNPRIDSLLERAVAERNPIPAYREILGLIRQDVPAIFLSAPSTVVAVHRRYRNLHFRPESLLLSLREWSVTPGKQLPRDGDE